MMFEGEDEYLISLIKSEASTATVSAPPEGMQRRNTDTSAAGSLVIRWRIGLIIKVSDEVRSVGENVQQLQLRVRAEEKQVSQKKKRETADAKLRGSIK